MPDQADLLSPLASVIFTLWQGMPETEAKEHLSEAIQALHSALSALRAERKAATP